MIYQGCDECGGCDGYHAGKFSKMRISGTQLRTGVGARGLALPLILGIVILLLLAIFNLVLLSHSEMRQSRRTADGHTAFYIAKSAYHKIASRVNERHWDLRFFRDAPYTENNQPFGGGSYSLFVEDTAGKEKQADIWISAEFAGVRRALFYRTKYVETVFDEVGKIEPIVVTSIEVEQADRVIADRSSGSAATAAINRLLGLRESNSPNLESFKQQLGSTNDVTRILALMGGNDPQTANTPARRSGPGAGGGGGSATGSGAAAAAEQGEILTSNVLVPSIVEFAPSDPATEHISNFFQESVMQASTTPVSDDPLPTTPAVVGNPGNSATQNDITPGNQQQRGWGGGCQRGGGGGGCQRR